MVIVAYPNIIESYSLMRLYHRNEVVLVQNLNLYHYQLQPLADIAFSQNGLLLYVAAVDPVMQVSVILIYNTAYISAASLHSVIHLDQVYSRPGFEIEVVGGELEYLTVIHRGSISVYLVYEHPTATIISPEKDYKF